MGRSIHKLESEKPAPLSRRGLSEVLTSKMPVQSRWRSTEIGVKNASLKSLAQYTWCSTATEPRSAEIVGWFISLVAFQARSCERAPLSHRSMLPRVGPPGFRSTPSGAVEARQ